MSEFVRLGGGTGRVVRVELKMFERLTHNQAPWVQESRDGKGTQRFGQCPECNGAMLLVNITNSEPQQKPHVRISRKLGSDFARSRARVSRHRGQPFHDCGQAGRQGS